jgi:protein-S-isoprenylcysteine O-methyltransferase Ste14
MSLAIGLTVALPGLLLRALASGHVRKNEQLATSGPYAYTRNPLYLGSLILAAGFAIAALSWWIAGIMTIFFVLIYVPVIRGEEAFLRGRFPEFDEYARTVPRLLPRLTARGNSSSQFSRELYLKHREYHALLGASAMAAALIAKLMWRH